MTGETNLRNIIDNPNWIVQKSHQAAYGLVPLLLDLGKDLRGTPGPIKFTSYQSSNLNCPMRLRKLGTCI